MPRIGVYAASFDPVTNGHLSIITKASELFDILHVIIAFNSSKKRHYPVNLMRDWIEKVLSQKDVWSHISSRVVKVVAYNGLIVDYCKSAGANYLVRGIRNTSDFLYEDNLATINSKLNPDIETLYLRASEPAVSSSMVRELIHYGKPIDEYVPKIIVDEVINMFKFGGSI